MSASHWSEAYAFFRANAGGVVGRSAAYAMALARAENAALERGWSFEWEWDDTPIEDEKSGLPAPAIGCVLRDERGNALGSIWGIEADASPWFVRLVQAELAHGADAAYRYPCTPNPAS